MELLLWYEAIFGKDMWKHVVVETSFWSHSLDAVSQRWQERGQVSDFSLLSRLSRIPNFTEFRILMIFSAKTFFF